MDYTYVEYIDGGAGTWAPVIKTIELTDDNFMEVIWDESRGPFSTTTDNHLRRTPEGMKALRTELEYRLNYLGHYDPTKETP